MATLEFEGGTYKPTAEDRLWLLRAVEAEGSPRKAVAQVLVNGFSWNRSRGGKGSLCEWIRAYSTPVNPRYLPGGDIFDASYEKASAAEKAKLDSLARRRKLASERTVFTRETHEAVARALEMGAVDVPKEATDFARWDVDATHGGKRPHYIAVSEARPGTNRLWTREPSWAGYVATMAGTTLPLASLLVAVLVAIAVARYG